MNKQTTIAKAIKITGNGWLSGEEAFISCYPGSDGITVGYKGTIVRLSIELFNNDEEQFSTSITIGDTRILMTEHLFSSIFGLSIDCMHIEFHTNEVPFCASSELFTSLFLEAGLCTLDKDRDYLRLNESITIEDQGRIFKYTPHHELMIKIYISFDNIIGKQEYTYHPSAVNYVKQITCARSFIIDPILNLDSPWVSMSRQFSIIPKVFPENPKEWPFISYTRDEYITPLRFPNEPVRHKLLDFLGDLLFLNSRLLGHIEIHKPGHSFNGIVVKELLDRKKND